jgi:hypothetical protein
MLLQAVSLSLVKGQDTITVPLKIRVGVEASGPAMYFADKNILNTEAYISIDLNEKYSPTISAGFLDYKYSQYNYDYTNKGAFIRIGTDVNLLKPDKSQGKYWAGLGLKYGLSLFNSEVPSFKHENYWGSVSSSVPRMTAWGHFLEISPGVRAEIFKNVSIGWTVSMRMLLYTGTGKDLRPIYFPGYGNGGKNVTAGLSYFLVWNIPYKKIKVIIKPEPVEEPDETTTPGTTQQGTGIRQ